MSESAGSSALTLPARFSGSAHDAAQAVHLPATATAVRSHAVLVEPDLDRACRWASGLRADASVHLILEVGPGAYPTWRAAAERRALLGTLWNDGHDDELAPAADRLRTFEATGQLTVQVRELTAGTSGGSDLFLHETADGRRIGVARERLHAGADSTVGEETLWVFEDPQGARHLDAIEFEVTPRTSRALSAPVTVGRSGATDAQEDTERTEARRLRVYQREAIDSWLAADGVGLVVMATGTGKTFTAIRGIAELASTVERGLVAVIMVPQTHLADQWGSELLEEGRRAIVCHTATRRWSSVASREIDLLRAGHRDVVTLVTTYATAQLPAFRTLLDRTSPDDRVLVVDEAHHYASRHADIPAARYRLGLTATPELPETADGTGLLTSFSSLVSSYDLGDAIRDEVLCRYCYHPHPVALTADEVEGFRDLTSRLRELMLEHPTHRDLPQVERLLDERSDLLDRASGKLEVLRQLLDASMPDRTIIYCSGRQQLEAVTTICWEQGISAHQLTSEESSAERRRLLDDFSDGRIPVLTAIRCLDEGVDVPGALEAYLVRSSANPTQSVQRRGRLLRRAPHKDVANIHDLVTVGGDNQLAQLELDRVKRFASDADNRDEALRRFETFWEERT